MTPRERMLVAMTNGMPDRVPVAPDMSNMIPCRLTGRPFWDIYYFADPPLWEAYLNAVKYFGFDGWFTDGEMQYQWPGDRTSAVEDMRKLADRWIVRYRGRIDGLRYTSETTYFRADSPTTTEAMIKDLVAEWDLVEKLFQPPTGYNPARLKLQRQAVGERGAFGVAIGYPGFQKWFGLISGSAAALTYAYYDHPDLIARLRELTEQQVIRQMEMVLAEKPDFVLLGASGTITLQSPKIAKELSLPTIKEIDRHGQSRRYPDHDPFVRQGAHPGEMVRRGDGPELHQPPRDRPDGRLRPGRGQAVLRKSNRPDGQPAYHRSHAARQPPGCETSQPASHAGCR